MELTTAFPFFGLFSELFLGFPLLPLPERQASCSLTPLQRTRVPEGVSVGALLCLTHLPLLLSCPGQVQFDSLHDTCAPNAINLQKVLKQMWLENTASRRKVFYLSLKPRGKKGLGEFLGAIPVLDVQEGGCCNVMQCDAIWHAPG